MAFFSFFYANLARFKKFKGLGFEAELWEDKQKEAANLIERLKSIVAIYTREIVMNNVLRGRISNGKGWVKRWQLFNELSGKHSELGQNIDFSSLKHDVDSVFIFDICQPLSNALRMDVDKFRQKAIENIQTKYGSPVTDAEGHNRDLMRLNQTQWQMNDLFERAKSENIARSILDEATRIKTEFAEHFNVNIEYRAEVIDNLQKMVKIIDERPVAVTPQLIEWAQRHEL